MRESDSIKGYAERNPKSFKKFQTAVAIKASEKLANSEFTPEQQHILKYQALQEFIDDGKYFPIWKTNLFDAKVKDRRITKIPIELLMDDKKRFVRKTSGYHPESDYQFAGKVYKNLEPYLDGFETYSDALWTEGFIENDNELNDIQRLAQKKINDDSWLGFSPFGSLRVENGSLAKNYMDTFDLPRPKSVEEKQYRKTWGKWARPKISVEELLPDKEEQIKLLLEKALSKFNKIGLYDPSIYGEVLSSNAQDDIENIANNAIKGSMGVADYFKQKLVREICSVAPEEYADKVRQASSGIDADSVFNEETRHTVVRLATYEALKKGYTVENGVYHFFKPIDFIKKETHGVGRGYYIFDDARIGLAREGLERISMGGGSLDVRNADEAAYTEFNDSAEQYIKYAEKVGALGSLMKSNFARNAIIASRLDFFEKFTSEKIMAINEGVKLMRELYDGPGYGDKGRGVWHRDAEVMEREWTVYTSPEECLRGISEEVLKEYEDELRQMSYAGFISIMHTSDDYDSRRYRMMEAAQKYFDYFKYEEHMDEFQEYLSETGHKDYYLTFKRLSNK